jgi:uncharacterized protein YdeI (YjbR/CyaY-like superfamily)
MEPARTLYVADRKSWRSWLVKHYRKEPEVWLIYYHKDTGKARISYNDAVEEALCFGWIDSTVKNLDATRFAQRFSPRKRNSGLSQMNKIRLHKLIAQKKVTKAGLLAVAHVFDPAEDTFVNFTIPPDILNPLQADAEAWRNFQKLPENYKRIRIAYIESRRRHGEDPFRKSLEHFIKMTARNKRIGFVKEMRF